MPQVNNISTKNIHSAGFNNSNSIQKYTGAVSSISDDLRINNEKCKSNIGTISGDIKINRHSTVYGNVHSISGYITVKDSIVDKNVTTVSGNINAVNSTIEKNIETVSGSIEVEKSTVSGNLETTSGRIDIDTTKINGNVDTTSGSISMSDSTIDGSVTCKAGSVKIVNSTIKESLNVTSEKVFIGTASCIGKINISPPEFVNVNITSFGNGNIVMGMRNLFISGGVNTIITNGKVFVNEQRVGHTASQSTSKQVEEVTINIAKDASVNDIVFYTKKCHVILEGNAKYNGEKKDGMQFTHVNAPKSHAYA
ncbi:DUF4097 domain-containing protein [Yersinia similis]|uniref:Uncharacterized protein n=1 Tax=Yersinia similis TaxID=367190 RepID=A0A0T9PVL8_9GAMM|nr:DUF4097 domain-containing protein [Yersinia similis]CNF32705.1 Uncharacterised protein [Yersinia similis]CNH83633.1 Uncharacterised protein [Yersinia similis]